MTGDRTTIRIDPVLCVIEHLHRDRALADDACAGRFTIAGETVDVGIEPDWLGAALPDDDEWRIEWTKFYYGLDLAHAYAETGDGRYLDTWIRLVGSYIAQVPVGIDSSDVSARRVQNWIYAWQAFDATNGFPGLPEPFLADLIERLAAQTTHIRDHLTAERNHRTLELYALLIVALALPDLDADGELRDDAMRLLHDNLLTDVRTDGVHREHSTHYHLIALRSFLGARENLRRRGITMPASYDERLSRACDFALHCHRPDGAIPATSDSDNGRYQDVLALGAEALDRDDLRYAATLGRDGAPPDMVGADFPDGGYWTQRGGWGTEHVPYADEPFLIFDCGPLGDGGHGHYDLLSFEAAAGGGPLVVDPGRFTYAEGEPNLRHWFKGTAAHNTVVVDGQDQVPYRRGKPRKGTHPEARFHGRLSGPGLDILDGEARSTNYDAIHRRQIAFVGGAYWIIIDRLTGETPHRYDLRFHLDAPAEGRVRVAREQGQWVVGAPGLSLVSIGIDKPSIEAGWVARQYGVRLPAPVVSIATHGANALFATVLAPRARGERPPSATFAAADAGWEIVVTDGLRTDRVIWHADPHDLTIGPLDGLGRAGWSRTEDGRAVAAALLGTDTWQTWDQAAGHRQGGGDR